MTITKLRPTFTFDQDRLDALAALAPEAFADGKVNWEALREALGDRVEDEGRDAEHFGLFWPGKRDARRLASTPSAGTLRPAPGEGVNEATTRHVFIEGDNLEVLKLLQKSYAGRVKMIYIDPPYNTGNDFIYSDNFTQPLEEYLRATGQADEMGRVLVTNTQAGGRYHSTWLNMMYPRMRLARGLLSEDGVLFVSIDDNEMHHLRDICDEVFGEENFIANMVWQSRTSISNDQPVSANHNHTLIYARDRDAMELAGLGIDESEYSNPDGDPRGPWKPVPLDANKPGGDTKYGILNQNTGQTYFPPHGRSWSVNSRDYQRLLDDGRIVFGRTGLAAPKRKLYLAERISRGDSKTPSSLILDSGTTQDGTNEVMGLFGQMKVFSYPKPVALIRRFLQSATDQDDIVLDFFAGSSTTAHAVFDLNHSDQGRRRFMMVQLPEPTTPDSTADQAGFRTIAEIGKERIRRVIQRMQAEHAVTLPLDRESLEDLGFRVFKLDRSHYKAWRDFEGGEVADLQTLFDRFESPLVEGWKPEDVLVEVLLMEGFPLDSTTETLPEFAHNTVIRVSSDLVAHRLFVCLDASVHDQTIADLRLSEEDIFICLDAALTDEAKVRLEDGRRVKVI